MTDEEIIEKFKIFTRQDSNAAISRIAISEGHIYSTDGRIAFVGKLNNPHANEIPKNYPINLTKGILEGTRIIKQWFEIKLSEFNILDESFKKECREESAKNRRDYRDRYVEEVCPFCNDTVYWDTWEEKLVTEKEAMPGFDVRDINKPTKIIFGSSESVLVDFCYLHQVMYVFGEPIRFGIGEFFTDDDNTPILYMKTIDNIFHGVLMTLRQYDVNYKADYVIKTSECI